MTIVCRAMTSADIVDVVRIQAEAYVDEILEEEAVIRARFTAVPECAWVVEFNQRVSGYLVAYQTPLGKLTPWGGDFIHDYHASNLYLHDLAMSSTVRGMGLGPQLVDYALAEAKRRQLNSVALISVQGSQGFWQKLGFSILSISDREQHENLMSYTGPAIYMARTIV